MLPSPSLAFLLYSLISFFPSSPSPSHSPFPASNPIIPIIQYLFTMVTMVNFFSHGHHVSNPVCDQITQAGTINGDSTLAILTTILSYFAVPSLVWTAAKVLYPSDCPTVIRIRVNRYRPDPYPRWCWHNDGTSSPLIHMLIYTLSHILSYIFIFSYITYHTPSTYLPTQELMMIKKSMLAHDCKDGTILSKTLYQCLGCCSLVCLYILIQLSIWYFIIGLILLPIKSKG